MQKARLSRPKVRSKSSRPISDRLVCPISHEPVGLPNQDDRLIEIGKSIIVDATTKANSQGKKTFRQFIEQVSALLAE